MGGGGGGRETTTEHFRNIPFFKGNEQTTVSEEKRENVGMASSLLVEK